MPARAICFQPHATPLQAALQSAHTLLWHARAGAVPRHMAICPTYDRVGCNACPAFHPQHARSVGPAHTMAGTVPRQRPMTPSVPTMCRATAMELLWGLLFCCSRVLIRSMGLDTTLATLPLMAPAAMLRARELFSLVAPSRPLMGA